jgi:hypothetical protein
MEVKKNMIFFVMRCQKPVKMSALDLFYLTLDTFMRVRCLTKNKVIYLKSVLNNIKLFGYGVVSANKFLLQILRAAWSYFALLHQVSSR